MAVHGLTLLLININLLVPEFNLVWLNQYVDI